MWMDPSSVRILLGVFLLAVCLEWFAVCEADQAKMTSMSEEGHGRVDLNKRDVPSGTVGERYILSKRSLGKRAPFRNDLGKRLRSNLARRLNFALAKRSPYGHYKLDLGKRDADEGLQAFHGLNDLFEPTKRTFRADRDKRPGSSSRVFGYPVDKRATIGGELGEKSTSHGILRRRLAIPEQTLDVELEAMWNLEQTAYPEYIQMAAERPLDDILPNQLAGVLDKRSAYFKNDLGKRSYFKSDLGKRDPFNSDLGKRSLYHWKRIYRTDLGR